ncbi:hypothetical protein M426DRAFT_65961 [Hypoxylon sp. CI-4A]|nr:hypothetical protein M426DRAFT_65961 [Hypoxylon sp. CI-4A]
MGSEYIPPLRLAILEADTPMPGIKAKYGEYGSIFTQLFERACESLDPPQPLSAQLRITSHDVVNDLDAYPDPETIDAILISGAKYSAFDDDEWIVRLAQYTRRCLEGGRVRVIGVCFGHQIAARAVGVDVARNTRGWEISVTDVDLTEEGKKIFGLEKLAIHQMHRDSVASLPPGAVPLASTTMCPVQAIYVPGRLFSVQGHPEFTSFFAKEIIETRRYGGILGEDIFKDGMRRAANKHDGVAVARAFLRFLRE